ncbi:calcium-binding protein, partial [Paraburkholderia megapolitana]
SQITLTGMLSQIGAGAQAVKLADGTVLSALQLVNMETTGTSGNDTLYGWAAGGNIFDGKGGSDVAIGHGNGDSFIFNQGYGSLDINESDTGATPDNVLKLGAGITASSLALSTQNGSDLLISDGVTGDQIKLDDMLTSTSSGIQTIQFADGTTLTRAQLLAMPVNVNGSAGVSQTLNGTSGDNVFDSHGGNDVETGAGGNDTYLLQPGYSGITINNGVSTSTVATGDLQLEDVNPDNVWLQQVGNNLQVSIMGSKTEATIDNWFSNTYSQLSEVTVAGGSSGALTLDSQVNQLIQAMATFSAAHSGFDITSPANPAITDPTLLAAVSSAWHH